MLDIFISSRVRRKIIIVFAKYPSFKMHVRGLSKIIKEDSGNIQRELSKLEKVGFLSVSRVGNTRTYQTNMQFPIFRELQSIVLKTQQQQSKLKSEQAAKRQQQQNKAARQKALSEIISDGALDQ
ncbi:MAG: ArsR family transcriptional regulator [Candidatus Nomurabacteria bacterium]|jgi:ABC-type branched-subunit amino acid transport system ATPase component|nr:ArsR family transcriptional regulator [Candidatus Nomurabacteria bacterium]